MVSARGAECFCLSVVPLAGIGWSVCASAHCHCSSWCSLRSHTNCTHVGLLFIPVARRVSTLSVTSLCWDVWPKLLQILPYK